MRRRAAPEPLPLEAAEAEPPRRAPDASTIRPPRSHPLEASPAAGRRPPEDDEDVLEETPDFLQDTPEHDRLWFEQKPPRDFDFDD